MARRTADELSGIPLSLVYIAGNLTDAEAAERRLTDMDIEYTLNLEPFTTTSVLGGEYMGLFVYVPTSDHQRSRELLESHGLIDTIPLEEQTFAEKLHGA